jgi:hypothetical protein
MKPIIGMLALAVLAGCQPQPSQKSDAGNEVAGMPAPAQEAKAIRKVAEPEDREPLTEPKQPIDPKSAEAAGQIVQHYGALIEQGRWADAANSWGDPGAASAFATQLLARGLKHLEIGKPSEPEGAAGSVYVSMPVAFYTGDKRAAADVTLRRVNGVPGSTQAQRRWHIERIEWKA